MGGADCECWRPHEHRPNSDHHGGGGGTPIYKPHRYEPPQRVSPVGSPELKSNPVLLFCSFFDVLVEQALRRVLVEYIKAMMSK